MKPEPNEKAPVYIAAIVAVIMVFAAKSDEAMIIPAALTLVMVVVIAAISSALAKRLAAGKTPCEIRIRLPETGERTIRSTIEISAFSSSTSG